MGRLVASVVLLLGACGDNVLDGPADLPDGETQPGGAGSVVARYEPQVCGVTSYNPLIGLDPAQDVSVAARASGGAALLAAPLSGGALTGLVIDPRVKVSGETITKLDMNTNFESVTVAFSQDRPVSTAIADGAIYVHMLDEALGNPQLIAKLPGTATAEGTFFHLQNQLVMPVATNDGLWMHRFLDESLEPVDSKQFLATKPVTAITAAQLGGSVMTAISTETECYLSLNSRFEDGHSTRMESACGSPRLALDQATGSGMMLFDSAEGVRLMPIHLTMFGGEAPVLRENASSPRVVFDGTRFWVSYLDTRGDVIVGFIEPGTRHAVTMSLGAPMPERSAYELTMVDGHPTVFSLDEGGYTAYSLCVETIE